jgi:hypothetical protein
MSATWTIRLTALPLLAAVLTAAGCGKELVVGGERDVEVTGTGGGAQPDRASVATNAAGARGSREALPLTGGTVAFTARAQLLNATGAAFPPGAPTGSATVRVDGADTVRVVAFRTSAGQTYRTVRLTFTAVEAQVTGLVVGGVEVTGTVSVAIPPGGLVVERSVLVQPGREPLSLLVELNAAAWLSAADAGTRIVPAAAFRDAVEVRVR